MAGIGGLGLRLAQKTARSSTHLDKQTIKETWEGRRRAAFLLVH